MSRSTTAIPFRVNTARAVCDASLRQAMDYSTRTFSAKRAEGTAQVPLEEWRERASAIRMQVLDNLADYVDRFSANATRAGAVVHRAKDAQIARDTVAAILKDRGIKMVVKAKSMVTEEIHLNKRLEEIGIEPVETDLGEYIVQIAGETPSHILAPAIHKSRKDIGRLFADKLGIEYTDDPEVLTKVARRVLREKFLAAKAGITGANFAIADTGSLVIFTNEGNGRMVTTLPRLHVAVLSVEKVIPSLADLSTFVRLLPRSASGQILSSYLSVITGTRKQGETTGAREIHIVLVDNGRSEIVKGEFREILKCIRCSACMNVCPVYKVIGGHAYGCTYPGPMGIVLTAVLEGMERAHPLQDATTFCGACVEVCPVKVPLSKLLRRLRERRAEQRLTPLVERLAMFGFGTVTQSPALFGLGQRMSWSVWPLLKDFSRSKLFVRLPRPARKTFKRSMS